MSSGDPLENVPGLSLVSLSSLLPGQCGQDSEAG